MNTSHLIKKLKNTDVASPRPEWVAQQRQMLMAQISTGQQAAPRGLAAFRQLVIEFFGSRVAYRFAATAVLVVAIVLSTSVTTAFAERSVSGDILYPVKVASEQVQLSLTTNKTDRARLTVDFAVKRLAEVRQIVAAEQDPDERVKKISETLKGYTKNISQAKEALNTLDNEANPDTVEVASLITDQVDVLAGELEASKKAVDDAVTEVKQSAPEKSEAVTAEAKAVKDAIAASDATVDNAVDVILKKHQDGEVSAEQVAQLAEKKLGELKKKVSQLSAKVVAAEGVVSKQAETLAAEEVAAEAESADDTVTEPAGEETAAEGAAEETESTKEATDTTEAVVVVAEEVPVKDGPTLDEQLGTIKDKPTEAASELVAAEALLTNGDAVGSLEKVKAIKQLTKEVEAIIDEVEATVGQPIVVEEAEEEGSEEAAEAAAAAEAELLKQRKAGGLFTTIRSYLISN